jgi:signal transduction histidine kinase
VDVVRDGQAASEQLARTPYDVVVLDVMLPRKSGLEICRDLRRTGSAVPVLMLTARHSIDDRVASFESGADDYLVKPFDFRELLARLGALGRRGTLPLLPDHVEAGPITLDTRHRTVCAHGMPIVLTARESDEIGQLAGAFNKLLDRVRAALQTQRQFMANASHEQRTPISVARTAAEVTLNRRDHNTEADYREALEIVEAQTRRLGRMVEDMLMLASADSGSAPLRLSTLYLDELALDCVRALSVIAEQKDVRLNNRGASDVLADADEELVRQLLTNLIENAIKHTPSGGSVTVALVSDGTAATITVSDTGPGIPERDWARVFDRFIRLDPARDSASGAGLGLPIARWIAHLHGGTLTLQRGPSGGCEFVARLPVLVPTVRPAGVATSATAQPATVL